MDAKEAPDHVRRLKAADRICVCYYGPSVTQVRSAQSLRRIRPNSLGPIPHAQPSELLLQLADTQTWFPISDPV
jgi:hypothetical protein